MQLSLTLLIFYGNNMSLFSSCRLISPQKLSIVQFFAQTRNYAAPGGFGLGKKTGKRLAAQTEKKVLPVETDVNRLLKYVCGTNIYKEGGQDVEIKPDSEYPDWLWTIRTGPAPPLEELDPNTKTYWRRVRKLGMVRNNKLASLRKF